MTSALTLILTIGLGTGVVLGAGRAAVRMGRRFGNGLAAPGLTWLGWEFGPTWMKVVAVLAVLALVAIAVTAFRASFKVARKATREALTAFRGDTVPAYGPVIDSEPVAA